MTEQHMVTCPAFATSVAWHGRTRSVSRRCSSPTRRRPQFARRPVLRSCAEAPAAAPRMPSADPNEVLSEEALAEWAEISALVGAVAPTVPADAAVAKAFGWGRLSQRFWRGDRVEEQPSLSRAKSSVEFLRSEPLSMSDDEIEKVLKKFPECLNLDVEDRMAANMSYLQKEYPAFKKGVMLKNAVLEQPAILGFSVDCGGDCMSECNRCWARF